MVVLIWRNLLKEHQIEYYDAPKIIRLCGSHRYVILPECTCHRTRKTVLKQIWVWHNSKVYMPLSNNQLPTRIAKGRWSHKKKNPWCFTCWNILFVTTFWAKEKVYICYFLCFCRWLCNNCWIFMRKGIISQVSGGWSKSKQRLYEGMSPLAPSNFYRCSKYLDNLLKE